MTLREIKSDNKSSATTLARRVIRLYRTNLTEAHSSSSPELKKSILGISNQLGDVHPSMTSLHTIALILTTAANHIERDAPVSESNHRILRLLSKLENHLNTSKERIAEEANSILPEDATIITLSYSETVAEALLRAPQHKRLQRVILSESRPLMEGFKLARRLRSHGIPVTLVVDAALPSLCGEADLALVGADTILPDGSVVHKIGTYPLALASSDQKSPFYVAADALKFQVKGVKYPFSIEEKSASEIMEGKRLSGVKVKNVYFDVTAPRLVTALITEFGAVKPSQAPEITNRLEGALRTTVEPRE